MTWEPPGSGPQPDRPAPVLPARAPAGPGPGATAPPATGRSTIAKLRLAAGLCALTVTIPTMIGAFHRVADQRAARARAESGLVLLNMSGTGMNQTEPFDVPDGWDINYSFDCLSTYFHEGSFAMFIYNSDGQPSIDNNGANAVGPGLAGVVHNHHGGTHYVQIISTCSWTVSIRLPV